jgi:hypothetical protein
MPKRLVYSRVADFGGLGRQPIAIKNGVEVFLGGQWAVVSEIVEDHRS